MIDFEYSMPLKNNFELTELDEGLKIEGGCNGRCGGCDNAPAEGGCNGKCNGCDMKATESGCNGKCNGCDL